MSRLVATKCLPWGTDLGYPNLGAVGIIIQPVRRSRSRHLRKKRVIQGPQRGACGVRHARGAMTGVTVCFSKYIIQTLLPRRDDVSGVDGEIRTNRRFRHQVLEETAVSGTEGAYIGVGGCDHGHRQTDAYQSNDAPRNCPYVNTR